MKRGSTEMNIDILRRLNEAMDLAGAPREDFTKKTQKRWSYGRNAWLQKRLGKKNVGRILRGQGMFKLKELPEIAEKLGVRFDWLVSGVGPKTDTKETLSEKKLNGSTEADRELIRRIRAAVDKLPKMDPKIREKLIKSLYDELSV